MNEWMNIWTWWTMTDWLIDWMSECRANRNKNTLEEKCLRLAQWATPWEHRTRKRWTMPSRDVHVLVGHDTARKINICTKPYLHYRCHCPPQLPTQTTRWLPWPLSSTKMTVKGNAFLISHDRNQFFTPFWKKQTSFSFPFLGSTLKPIFGIHTKHESKHSLAHVSWVI